MRLPEVDLNTAVVALAFPQPKATELRRSQAEPTGLRSAVHSRIVQNMSTDVHENLGGLHPVEWNMRAAPRAAPFERVIAVFVLAFTLAHKARFSCVLFVS